jgi:maleylacetoacetate isomerase
MAARVTLFNYWRSSSSHRVRIALAYKGLDYDYVAVNLLSDEQHQPAHAARSPMGHVPCLVYDGLTYVESVAIVELLEERHPEPRLYPGDVHGRARVRALVEMVNSGIQPLHNRGVLQHLSPDPAEQKKWAKHFVEQGLGSLEAALAMNAKEGVRGPFAFGESVTAADVFLVPQVVAARRFAVDATAYPRVLAAHDAAMEHQAFQRAAPEHQPDAVSGRAG